LIPAPTCNAPPFPADIEPRVVKQPDGSFVISGEDIVAMMQWIEQLAQREKALTDCLDAAGSK
jgi:hypothetical protein